jgi:tetratricopeptide (TPR) repeat protein
VGDVHATADNVVSAIEYYERALALAERNGASAGTRVVLELKITDALFRRGQHGEVRERLSAILARSRELGDPVLTARVVARLGRVENTLANYETARDHCLEAYRVLRSTEAHEEMGRLELTLGAIAHRLGDTSLARDYYESALATFRRIDDSVGIALTLNNLGVLLISGARWLEARDYFMRAIAVAEEAGNYARLGSLCLNLGILCYKSGEWALAQKHLTRALVISKETNPNLAVIRVHLALGVLKLRMRQLPLAESHFNQILEMARLGGFKREEALALEFLGEKHLREGELDRAERNLLESLAICEACLSDGDVGFEVHTRLAEIALRRGLCAVAREHANAALEPAERMDNGVELGRAFRLLGEAAAHEGNFDEAAVAFARASEILSSTPDVLELAYSRLAEARFLAARGRSDGKVDRETYRSAVAMLEDLVARFQDLQLPELSVETLLEIANTHAAYADLDEALAAIGRGLDLAEREAIPRVANDLEACCGRRSRSSVRTRA